MQRPLHMEHVAGVWLNWAKLAPSDILKQLQQQKRASTDQSDTNIMILCSWHRAAINCCAPSHRLTDEFAIAHDAAISRCLAVLLASIGAGR